MKRRIYWLAAGAAALVLGVSFLAAPRQSTAADTKGTDTPVPAEEVNKLIAQSEKVIETELAGKLDKPGVLRARTAAIMIAVFSQYGPDSGKDPQHLALRDAALQLADSLKAEKFDAAKKQLAGLKSVKPNSAAKPKVDILDKTIELEDFMGQMSSERAGGLGVEKVLEDLGDMKELKPADVNEDLLLIADRAKIIVVTARNHEVEKKELQKKWEGLADTAVMRATELADAVRGKKDPKEVLKAVVELNKSCTACHKVFKNP